MIRYPNLLFLAPPFTTHFQAFAVIGRLCQRMGANVTFAGDKEFGKRISGFEHEFYRLELPMEAQTGLKMVTDRGSESRQRVSAFLRATEKGATRMLIYQNQNRLEGMLGQADLVFEALQQMQRDVRPDLVFVDQFCFGLKLALYGLNLKMVTVCSKHPFTLPFGEHQFDIPRTWPKNVPPSETRLKRLQAVTADLEAGFTAVFNQKLARFAPQRPPLKRAFSFVGEQVLFRYPHFPVFDQQQWPFYAQFMSLPPATDENRLDQLWLDRLNAVKDRQKVMISLGPLLSARNDVLARLILAVRQNFPQTALFISAGKSYENLRHFAAEHVFIEAHLPQVALLNHMNGVVHHGGCNTFNEALAAGVPMLVLPFVSEQYNIAKDVEDYGLGMTFDPNHFSAGQIQTGLQQILNGAFGEAVGHWRKHLKAADLQAIMAKLLQK